MQIKLKKEHTYSQDGINAKTYNAGTELTLPDIQALKWINAGIAEQVHIKEKRPVQPEPVQEEVKEEKQEVATKEEKTKNTTK